MPAPRVALWGAGTMAGAHAASCRALGWDVVGVASRRAASAARLAADIGAEAMTYDGLLRLDRVDMVIVTTPAPDHLVAAEAWSARGVPTLLSTPMCRTLAEADRLVELDSAATMLVDCHVAMSPAAQAMFGRVRALGEVTSLSGRSIRAAPSTGAATTGEWGGGVLLHAGAQHVGLMLLLARLAGLGAPVSVSARVATNERGVDDHAELELSFERGRADMVISWRGSDHPSWDVQMASAGGVLRLELDGRPALEQNGEPVPTPRPRSTPAAAAELADVGLLAQLTAFRADIVAGRRPVLDMAFGRAVLDVVTAGYWSAAHSGDAASLPFSGPRGLTPIELLGAEQREN